VIGARRRRRERRRDERGDSLIFSKASRGKRLFAQRRSGSGRLSALIVVIAVTGCVVLAFARGGAASATEAVFGCISLMAAAVALALITRIRFGRS
jgi:uncharacterized membrane protein